MRNELKTAYSNEDNSALNDLISTWQHSENASRPPHNYNSLIPTASTPENNQMHQHQ